ncbi:MAG: YgiT-type zinc finger protein [Desulfotomaculaceae bacterium]|nr:YgiT-type zinc finger protein [Desulfotomaculaceae bacterium]
MQCYICDGNMTKVQKDVEITWKGKTMLFEGINFYVCESCGEEAYEPDVKAMQLLIERANKKNEYPAIMHVGEIAYFLRISSQTISSMFRPVACGCTCRGQA